jgi:hypothetical protein
MYLKRCIVCSFIIPPAWIQHPQNLEAQGLQYQRARQQQRRMALSQQVPQFETQMRRMRNPVNAFSRLQGAQAAQVNSWGNTLTGITPTTDLLSAHLVGDRLHPPAKR